MTQVHDTYHHDTHGAGFSFGIATGFMLVMAALLIAAVVAGVALLVAQPWDDDGAGTPNVPAIEEPVDGAPGAPQAPGQ